METINKLPLSDIAYTSRVKLPKWNGRTCALNLHPAKTSAKIIAKVRPDLNQQSHMLISTYHAARANRLLNVYNKVLERAALETFGRSWTLTDYKVSGIGSDALQNVTSASCGIASTEPTNTRT